MRGSVYYGRLEPRGAIDYWHGEVVYDAPALGFDFDEAVHAIARHQARL